MYGSPSMPVSSVRPYRVCARWICAPFRRAFCCIRDQCRRRCQQDNASSREMVHIPRSSETTPGRLQKYANPRRRAVGWVKPRATGAFHRSARDRALSVDSHPTPRGMEQSNYVPVGKPKRVTHATRLRLPVFFPTPHAPPNVRPSSSPSSLSTPAHRYPQRPR